MSYDFFMDKAVEFDDTVRTLEEKNNQISNERNGERKKQLRKEIEQQTNNLWKKINDKGFSEHVKYKIMQSFLSARPSVERNLKGLYQSKLFSDRQLCIEPYTPIDVTQYPAYTLFLQFKFRLAKPYISKDDEVCYICDNPIRKEKVFKLPMVSSSTWKGNMRFAARKEVEVSSALASSMTRLFGNEKEASSDFRQGRLWFYDTFFKKIDLEVINPHDRKTKAGTIPITIESVPSGEEGYFRILYCPFDLMGGHDAQKVREEVADDLSLLSSALKLMMLKYGFSAKKTAGYGVIRPKVSEVNIDIKKPQSKQFPTTEVPFKDMITELNRLAGELRQEGCNESSH